MSQSSFAIRENMQNVTNLISFFMFIEILLIFPFARINPFKGSSDSCTGLHISYIKNTLLLPRKRQVVAAPNEQQFVMSGRWWTVGRQNVPIITIMQSNSSGNLTFLQQTYPSRPY